jgi:hypothetical protein
MAGNDPIVWRKSGACSDQACVEVAIRDHDVLVRHSKDQGFVLTFTHEEWASFLGGVKAGEFTAQPR